MTSKYETELDLDNRNNSHTRILDLVGKGKKVLDVGTATGYLAEALVGRGCRVTGIELDPRAAEQAKRHCEKVVVGDVETLDLSAELDEASFDVVVFGDVLEHLKDPLRALERLKPFLGPDGYVVASIPNVAHGSVRLALMQGRFQYRPLGLLDNTHLRFFTRESTEQLFHDAGFRISKLERTRLGIFDTEVEIDRELVTGELLKLVRSDPEALTYQFVLTAHPSDGAAEVGPPEVAADERELERLRWEVAARDQQLAQRDEIIHELNRKLRAFEDLRRLLEDRTERLARKEREVSELMQEVTQRNHRLTRLEQSFWNKR